jgi:hypothetical protein
MMLCRTVVINFIYLEIFTQAIQQISTGRGGAPTIRRRRRADAKFSAAAWLARRRARSRMLIFGTIKPSKELLVDLLFFILGQKAFH